ncbi:MAG: hypothetical protein A2W61_06655 [Deltaproteobacteria bacterium RIFCSPLOWO2_01_44_7]|nr:MAG: hypothetical protein A2712_05365 [Deltaproteobacteria bacterium RIFCSPHIGHO2_01_FULL_43_49]OGQ14368.1 MAG: hypothetical protein A3D22_05020 [Deltaproteobacteria bacterium RIFCSPHIGHO2_02_FULL_44_53]OGQ27592.1 MAG: hypothetical protein A3D98_09155 [Deltaproteobacteria bacterium RIFCSPHIGHO2_12_FULL_44_21]OGQ30809.1 MAG: hypothetical protein A2979_01430 [Deltaproteobacteria bacterium RIFCSPLOWO2_01_FULL_45_74]OGQ38819.1 MAG: hypothetical protein A2W61_06655 [Deltaproteobacteria bacterium 
MKIKFLFLLIILFFGCRDLSKVQENQDQQGSVNLPAPQGGAENISGGEGGGSGTGAIANQPPVVSIFMNGQPIDLNIGLSLVIGKTVDGFEVRAVDPDGDPIQKVVTILSTEPAIDPEAMQLSFYPMIGKCEESDKCTFGFAPADIISQGQYTISIGVADEPTRPGAESKRGDTSFKAMLVLESASTSDVIGP